tara:strand:- start:1362 stop:1901 length:540 start_codon:yes stop_codon:yes gene_type:complete
MLLALDISTSCTGYCIFNEDELVAIDYISLGKYKDMYEKANRVKSVIQELKQSHNITSIAVEENLQSFRPGLSSAKTLLTLAQFNGIVRLICYNEFDIKPLSINVNSARKSVGLKVIRKSVVTTKDQVANWVLQTDKAVSFETREVTRGKKKGQTVFLNEVYDMADAYVIGKAYNAIKK